MPTPRPLSATSLASTARPKASAEVIAHTDGSCLGNPGPGGWAVRLSSARGAPNTGSSASNSTPGFVLDAAPGSVPAVKTLAGGFRLTTNNRMEIYAAIMALEALKRPCSVDLYTDSRYVCDAVEKGWLKSWLRSNWIKSDKKPVLNRDLWERLLPLLSTHKVRLHWVRGHAGHVENEEVDTLARAEAARPGQPPDTGYAP